MKKNQFNSGIAHLTCVTNNKVGLMLQFSLVNLGGKDDKMWEFSHQGLENGSNTDIVITGCTVAQILAFLFQLLLHS